MAQRGSRAPKAGSPETAAPTGEPLPNCCFRVLIDGEEIGLCQVSAFGSEDLVPPRGGKAVTMHRPVILRRAVSDGRELFEWRQAAATSKRRRRDVTLELLDPARRVAQRWVLHDCQPVRWTGPALDALAPVVACEELEITYRAISWT